MKRTVQRSMKSDSRNHASVARPELSSASGAESQQINEEIASFARYCAYLVDNDKMYFGCDESKSLGNTSACSDSFSFLVPKRDGQFLPNILTANNSSNR